MFLHRCLGVLVLSLLLAGCSQGPSPVRVKGPSPSERAKAALEEVVKTGQVGSGLTDVESYLTELKKTDAPKADGLTKQLEELQHMEGKPDQAKAKAKELIDKL